LQIDVRFDIKDCLIGGCSLCLTSTCLDIDGLCPSGGSGCQPFTPGNLHGDPGDYLRDCSQDGGWDATWEVDATDCLTGSPGFTCPSISIHVTCYPRINPANPTGDVLERLCKDCDCVCECVFIGYEEAGCLQMDSALVCWNDGWTASLDLDWDEMVPCPGGQQTVTVTLVRDEATGCCYWQVTITKGVFAEGYPGEGTTTALVKTDCPEIDITLGIELPGDDTGIVTVICGNCGVNIDTCCACEWLEPYHASYTTKYPNRGRLKATFTGAFSGYIVLCPDNTDVGISDTCLQWRATCAGDSFANLTETCGMVMTTFDFACRDKDRTSGGPDFYMQMAGDSAECGLTNPVLISESCGPPLEIVWEVTLESIDPDPENPCPCDGQTITITLTPHDPIP